MEDQEGKMNEIRLIGELTGDPKVEYVDVVVPVCKAIFNFSVERKTNKKGNDIFTCVAFDKNAEFARKYLKEGRRIGISGHLQSTPAENEKGEAIRYISIVVDEFFFTPTDPAEEDYLDRFCYEECIPFI